MLLFFIADKDQVSLNSNEYVSLILKLNPKVLVPANKPWKENLSGISFVLIPKVLTFASKISDFCQMNQN